MDQLFKKITTLVSGRFTGTVPSLSGNMDHEENIENESDAHKTVSARNKILLQSPNYGSQREEEK